MKNKELMKLLDKMTFAEKVGQLTQLSGEFFDSSNQEVTGPVYEMMNQLSQEQIYTLGSVLGVDGVANIQKIQAKHLENARLKIPLLFMADVIHGARTIFPIPLGLSTSFNPDLVEETARIAAKEATASGLHVTFSPMVDLSRDARWGRVMEGTGEDPYLNSVFAASFVKGYQGDLDQEHLAACVKHFAAYGAVESGREYNTVDIPENKLRELYLPAYKAAIDAGVKLVMTAFNTVNGLPATGNQWLMKNVLRDEMGFDGVLITDYGAVMEQVEWGTATNEKDAASQTLEATVDIEMMTLAFINQLEKSAEENPQVTELVNAAVFRVLTLKNDLGLFEDPYRQASLAREQSDIFTADNKKLAYQAALESIVLLKNDNQVLPLKAEDKVFFDGPNLNNQDLLGAWRWKGDPEETQSISDIIEHRPQSTKADAEKIVLVVGESSDMSGESKSYTKIDLPQAQQDLIDDYHKAGKVVILVVLAGRPLDLSAVNDKVQAIFYSYFPGTMAAQAILDLLDGKSNPSAKLTMSLPRAVGQVPIYYNNYQTGRPTATEDEDYVSRYQDCLINPLYSFGHGLSYSVFVYSDSSIKATSLGITVETTLTNTGVYDGQYTALVFVRDLVGSTARPLKELKAFKKVSLKAGQSQSLTLTIDREDLKFYNFKNEHVFESGDFDVFIGHSAEEIAFSQTINL